MTGQSKKSQSGNISPVWGEAEVIMYAKFQDDTFRGYNFTRGRISHFPIDFAWALQQCSASALPVITSKQKRCFYDIISKTLL